MADAGGMVQLDGICSFSFASGHIPGMCLSVDTAEMQASTIT